MSDWDLLQDYFQHHSEDSFANLVQRHLDLVYSVALRQLRSPQLAEEVAQSVFSDLASAAHQLKPDTILTAWLYQVARRTAIDVVRRESRRQLRERLAPEMINMSNTSSTWAQIEPLLDEAIETLDQTDRSAILLRYFQNKSFREVGQTLGTSEDAAQKRVSRAVERLREFFSRRGVAVGASGLVLVLSVNAVQSAPVGLGSIISSAAVLSTTSIHATTLGITKGIAMTTMQKGLITAAIVTAVGVGIYEAQRASHLQHRLQTLETSSSSSSDPTDQLRSDRDEALRKLQLASQEIDQLRQETAELPKLRGEIARLGRESQALPQPKPAAPAAGADSTEATAKSWLARVELLKQRLELAPEKKIPEFQFITDQDWLSAAKGKLETDDDYRRAMSELRRIAENKFVSMARPAVTEYVNANNGKFPTELSQLQPFFKSPLDQAVLDRYTILPAAAVPNVRMGGDWIITQKAPVDEEYDTRSVIGPNGNGSTSFKSSQTMQSTIDTLAPVIKAFSAANNGLEPTDPSQLLPYLTTPAQQAELQKVIQSRGEKNK